MKSKVKVTLVIVLAILVLGSTEVYAASPGHDSEFSYDGHAAVLRQHVDDEGMVSYAALKKEPTDLGRFVQALGAVKPETYEKWDAQAKIAFWINAYNALTLEAIIDHYPIKAGLLSGLVYPKNSIRQISGVWDKLKFTVMGERTTLEHIEHKILRARFNEPRIHMALVCAAVGCPALRHEPYVGDRLDRQLDDQARHFLGDRDKFRIDRSKDVVYLSPIFKWFAEDFVKTYAPARNLGRHDEQTSAVLYFVSGYLNEADRHYIRSGDFKVKYLDYDWSLNEREAPK